MGLLESVLGSVLGGANASQQPAPSSPSMGGLGGLGGLGGIVGALAANPQLLQVLMSLLSGNRGAQAQGGGGLGDLGNLGGLGGLAAQFQQAGLGDVLSSWIGGGQNRAVSPDQLTQVFGQDQLSQLGAQLGMDGSSLAGELSNILPGLIDQMTPQGHVPQPGEPGSGADGLFGMLEAFQRR
jgi:uncharacterized protein YidB (DUF937 family)